MNNLNTFLSKTTRWILPLILCMFFNDYALSETSIYEKLQSSKDSLSNIWNNSKSKDNDKMDAIVALAKLYARTQPDSAFYYASLGAEYAKRKNLPALRAEAINIQGISYFNKGDFTTALTYFKRGLKINQELKEKKQIAASLNNIGAAYQGQSNYFVAIDYFMRSLKIRDELGDRNGITSCLNNIGNCYLFHNEYDKAITYYNRSLKIKKELQDKKGISSVIGNLGLVNKERGNYNQALKHYNDCIRIKKEIGDSIGLSSAYQYIGKVYFLLEDYDQAIYYTKKSLPIKEKLQDLVELANINITLGDIFKSKGNLAKTNNDISLANKHYKTSIDYCLKGLDLIKNQDADIVKLDAASVLKQVYFSIGKYKESAQMHEQYLVLRDSTDRIGSQKELIRQEFKYDYDKKTLSDSLNFARQQEVLDISNQHSQNIRYGFTFFFLVVLGFLFLRYRSTQKRKTTENLLKHNLFKEEIKNKELEEERLNRELEMQNDQLTKLALDINRRREFVESLVQKLKVIKRKAPHEMNDTVNDAIMFSKNEINLDQSIYNFQKNVQEISYEFFEKLDNKHPELTKGEKSLCGLLRLNLSNKEMGILKGVSHLTIKVAKNKLRRKLELPTRANLTEFLKKL